MHTRDQKVGKRAARRDRHGPENSTCRLNSMGESLRWCTNLMPRHRECAARSGSIVWRVWVKVSRDALSLAECDITTATWGARAACSARDFRRVFLPRSAGSCSRRPPRTTVQLTAIGMKHHAYTDGARERDTAGGGGVATRLQRQSVIAEYCGWADRD